MLDKEIREKEENNNVWLLYMKHIHIKIRKNNITITELFSATD